MAKTTMVELSPEEIAEHFWVEVTIKPPSIQDKMAQSQIAQALRAPGSDGRPSMSDRDIAAYVFEYAHPEELQKNIDLQMFEAASPEVQELKQAALLEEWKDEHKELVKVAEKILNPVSDDAEFERFRRELTPEKLEALIQLAAEAKHAQMMGVPPEQMMMQAQAQAALQDAAARQASLLPASVAPPGQPGQPSPQVMPSQMNMLMGAQAQTSANPVMQQASQMRRGRPVNKP